MTLNQALKKKNRLVSEIKALYELTKTQNSLEESAPRRYKLTDVYETISIKLTELVALKVSIHTANKPMFAKIFLIAELKGLVKQIKLMPTDEGKVMQRYGAGGETKTVEIDIVSKNVMISELELQIESLQDALDKYNAITDIN